MCNCKMLLNRKSNEFISVILEKHGKNEWPQNSELLHLLFQVGL